MKDKLPGNKENEMKTEEKAFVKLKFGSTKETTRIWLPGDSKSVIQQLKDKGFEVITARPSRAAEKPAKAPKAPKAPKAKKAAKQEAAA